MFFSWNGLDRRSCKETVINDHFSNMTARAAEIRGGKIEIWKGHSKIYSFKTFHVKLPNDWTITTDNRFLQFLRKEPLLNVRCDRMWLMHDGVPVKFPECSIGRFHSLGVLSWYFSQYCKLVFFNPLFKFIVFQKRTNYLSK